MPEDFEQDFVLYLDTSALVKLYVDEPGTADVREAVEDARLVATSDLSYVEARSALSRGERSGTITTLEHDSIVSRLDEDFRSSYYLRKPDGGIIVRAGIITRTHSLRAYDALHLATALALRDELANLGEGIEGENSIPVRFETYDLNLLDAARREELVR